MVINIMGPEWTVLERSESEDARLSGCDGYCDWTTRRLVVERELTGSLEDMTAYVKKVKRHEIVHAFLLECGLHECSGGTEAWAANETMVDWFARVGPRIYKAWEDADAI